MKKIVKRRRTFRINNPLAFGILCAMILILLIGVSYALVAGVISPAIVKYKVANATPTMVSPLRVTARRDRSTTTSPNSMRGVAASLLRLGRRNRARARARSSPTPNGLVR